MDRVLFWCLVGWAIGTVIALGTVAMTPVTSLPVAFLMGFGFGSAGWWTGRWYGETR